MASTGSSRVLVNLTLNFKAAEGQRIPLTDAMTNTKFVYDSATVTALSQNHEESERIRYTQVCPHPRCQALAGTARSQDIAVLFQSSWRGPST